MIIFDKVTKVYDDNYKALDEVDLQINDGEFISVVGPSGAGKTTLLKMLIKEELPTKGKILVDDQFLKLIVKLMFFRQKIYQHRL